MCGHSFCSLCIRRHCDPIINRFTANVCPICKAKADTFDLRKNVNLAIAVEHFGEFRADLAAALSRTATASSSDKPIGARTLVKSGKEITTRLPQFNLHGLSKDKVKKTIDQTTKDSRIKLRLDGDKEALDKRLKDFVHLHNAQIGALHPLSLDQVVEKINIQSLAVDKENAKAAKTLTSVEKLKNGHESAAMAMNFKKLAKVFFLYLLFAPK